MYQNEFELSRLRRDELFKEAEERHLKNRLSAAHQKRKVSRLPRTPDLPFREVSPGQPELGSGAET